MRLPRMTNRRWTLVVATVALLLGAWRLAVRRAYFLGGSEAEASRADDVINGRFCFLYDPYVEGFPERLAAHYLFLARKYERAATRPWFAVEPDPLRPDP
jgi:hypothetical protein